MKENLNGGFEKLPENNYVWEIYDVSELQQKAKSVQRTWKLNTSVNGDIEQLWFYMRPFEYRAILLAIGFVIDPEGNVEWEIEQVKGKRFQAVLTYREFNGKSYPQLSMIQACNTDNTEEIPF